MRRHISTVEKELEELKVKHKSLKDDAEFRLLGAQKRIKLLVKGSEYKTALIDDAEQYINISIFNLSIFIILI